MDIIPYLFARFVYAFLGMLPYRAAMALFRVLIHILCFLSPRYKSTAFRNLEIAFPNRDEAWRKEVYRKSIVEMSRLFADAVRLQYLDEQWVKDHVTCEALDIYAKRLRTHVKGTGVLVATGHLGSFELLGHAIGLFGYPVCAVARSFRSERIDAWWKKLREARGNRIIGRRGAFKEMVTNLQSGRSVAVLFDQNVTRNHACFVDWFGTPAATTRSVALAAIRTEAPVFVASVRYAGGDCYIIEAVECNFESLYSDHTLSLDEKVALITQEISNRFCEMIEKFPEGWFWIHRRWRTRPGVEERNPYEQGGDEATLGD